MTLCMDKYTRLINDGGGIPQLWRYDPPDQFKRVNTPGLFASFNLFINRISSYSHYGTVTPVGCGGFKYTTGDSNIVPVKDSIIGNFNRQDFVCYEQQNHLYTKEWIWKTLWSLYNVKNSTLLYGLSQTIFAERLCLRKLYIKFSKEWEEIEEETVPTAYVEIDGQTYSGRNIEGLVSELSNMGGVEVEISSENNNIIVVDLGARDVKLKIKAWVENGTHENISISKETGRAEVNYWLEFPQDETAELVLVTEKILPENIRLINAIKESSIAPELYIESEIESEEEPEPNDLILVFYRQVDNQNNNYIVIKLRTLLTDLTTNNHEIYSVILDYILTEDTYQEFKQIDIELELSDYISSPINGESSYTNEISSMNFNLLWGIWGQFTRTKTTNYYSSDCQGKKAMIITGNGNNALKWEAGSIGEEGNDISVEFVDLHTNDHVLSTSILDNALTVYLATNANGEIITTANDILAQNVNVANVINYDTSNGLGIITPRSKIYLSGGKKQIEDIYVGFLEEYPTYEPCGAGLGSNIEKTNIYTCITKIERSTDSYSIPFRLKLQGMELVIERNPIDLGLEVLMTEDYNDDHYYNIETYMYSIAHGEAKKALQSNSERILIEEEGAETLSYLVENPIFTEKLYSYHNTYWESDPSNEELYDLQYKEEYDPTHNKINLKINGEIVYSMLGNLSYMMTYVDINDKSLRLLSREDNIVSEVDCFYLSAIRHQYRDSEEYPVNHYESISTRTPSLSSVSGASTNQYRSEIPGFFSSPIEDGEYNGEYDNELGVVIDTSIPNSICYVENESYKSTAYNLRIAVLNLKLKQDTELTSEFYEIFTNNSDPDATSLTQQALAMEIYNKEAVESMLNTYVESKYTVLINNFASKQLIEYLGDGSYFIIP